METVAHEGWGPRGTLRRTLDARLAGYPVAGAYTRRLAEGLAGMLGPDFVLLVDPDTGWRPPPGPRPVPLAGPVDTPVSTVRLGAKAPEGLLHIPHTAGPLWHRGPLVVTVHDPLAPLSRILGRLRLLATLRRAHRVIVPDEVVREMLRYLAPSMFGKVRMVPPRPRETPRSFARAHLEVYHEAEDAWRDPPWP